LSPITKERGSEPQTNNHQIPPNAAVNRQRIATLPPRYQQNLKTPFYHPVEAIKRDKDSEELIVIIIKGDVRRPTTTRRQRSTTKSSSTNVETKS
jgi:hypothetical protein